MSRLLLGAAIGAVVATVVGAALQLHAEPEPTDETIAVAEEAGVDAWDLQGAVNTTLLEPREYLYAVGELARPAPPSPPGWPLGGWLGQRIYCVEGIESSHGRFMFNPHGWPPPFYSEHAQGWLGFLPSTARRWGVVIGDRASEWAGAARMIQAGAGGQFFGIASGRC